MMNQSVFFSLGSIKHNLHSCCVWFLIIFFAYDLCSKKSNLESLSQSCCWSCWPSNNRNFPTPSIQPGYIKHKDFSLLPCLLAYSGYKMDTFETHGGGITVSLFVFFLNRLLKVLQEVLTITRHGVAEDELRCHQFFWCQFKMEGCTAPQAL